MNTTLGDTGRGDGAVAVLDAPPTVTARGRQALARAEQRVLDAEAEFDAQVSAGAPLYRLRALEHERRLAVRARDASR